MIQRFAHLRLVTDRYVSNLVARYASEVSVRLRRCIEPRGGGVAEVDWLDESNVDERVHRLVNRGDADLWEAFANRSIDVVYVSR